MGPGADRNRPAPATRRTPTGGVGRLIIYANRWRPFLPVRTSAPLYQYCRETGASHHTTLTASICSRLPISQRSIAKLLLPKIAAN
jgi:hypothetical protein